MKEKTEKPVKFRWIMIMVLVGWGVMIVCFKADTIIWPEFTFVHTLLTPIVLLVAMTPISIKSVVSSRLAMPGLAVWEGIMVPATYLVARQATGFGPHCDRAFVLAGGLLFLLFSASWTVKSIARWCKKFEANAIHW